MRPFKLTAMIFLAMSLGSALASCAFFEMLFNKPPQAVIEAFPTAGFAPLEVTFDGSASFDPDGRLASFHWDFGDGQSASEKIVTHIYKVQGDFVATLTVTDNKGAKGSDSIGIEVGPPLPR